MKKIILLILSAILALALAGCGGGPQGQAPQPSQPQTELRAYGFAFEDVDGNVRRLSDFIGKPVYLEVWGTWCSVCMASLPDLDKFAGEEHDFTVLSVVFPDTSGELSKEDFIKWYKDAGYKNLIVLLDENQQILRDFGISAFPSGIVFDGGGVPVTGFAGLMPQESIEEIMKQVAEGTYER